MEMAFRNQVAAMKLTTRITLLASAFMTVLIVLVALFSYLAARFSMLEREQSAVEEMLIHSQREAASAALSCKRAAGQVSSDKSLIEALTALGESGQSGVSQAFYSRYIIPLRRLVRANPTLYDIRLYLYDRRVPVMVPAVLHADMMRGQSWYQGVLPAANSWKFDETDSLFGGENETKYVFYFQDLMGPDGLEGILEVSVPMTSFLPELYTVQDKYWMGFIDQTGTLFFNRTLADPVWKGIIGTTVYGALGAGTDGTLITIGEHTIYTASIPVETINGRIVIAVLLDEELRSLRMWEILVVLVMSGFGILCLYGLHRVVRTVTGRLTALTVLTREVQRGDLNVVVPEMGSDEMGAFAAELREMVVQLRMQLQRNVERELLVKNTEIRALQNQINAHFIYNVLESIKMMAEIDGEFKLSDAVTSLGKLLRYSMKWVSPVVELCEELDYIHNYISLLNLRYDYVVTLDIQVPEDLMQAQVPKMSLQPIVENAVYHGFDGLEADMMVRICAMRGDAYYQVEITDFGKGMTPEALDMLRRRVNGQMKELPTQRHGIGLKNIQDRIRLNCGADYGLFFESLEGSHTKVIMRLPLIKGGVGL